MFNVIKRDGEKAEFNLKKISEALTKAFEATKKWTMPLRNWGKVYGELSIMYDGRL